MGEYDGASVGASVAKLLFVGVLVGIDVGLGVGFAACVGFSPSHWAPSELTR